MTRRSFHVLSSGLTCIKCSRFGEFVLPRGFKKLNRHGSGSRVFFSDFPKVAMASDPGHIEARESWRKKELLSFITLLPDIVQDLTKDNKLYEYESANKWLAQVLQYNLKGGERKRGLSVLQSYRILAAPEDIEHNNIKKAQIMGWCVEMLNSSLGMTIEGLDRTKEETPDWYYQADDKKMFDPARIMETAMHKLLWLTFSKDHYYPNALFLIHDGMFFFSPLVEHRPTVNFLGLQAPTNKRSWTSNGTLKQSLFTTVPAPESGSFGAALVPPFFVINWLNPPVTTHKAVMGHVLDRQTRGDHSLDLFTMNRYSAIVQYTASHPSFKLPVMLALNMAGIQDEEIHRQASTILKEMGQFYQVQKDNLNFQLDSPIEEDDIANRKCSWLAVVALQRASKAQKTVLQENYGSKDPEKIKTVKNLYHELGLPAVFKRFEEHSYELLCTQIQQISRGIPHRLFFHFLDKWTHRDT